MQWYIADEVISLKGRESGRVRVMWLERVIPSDSEREERFVRNSNLPQRENFQRFAIERFPSIVLSFAAHSRHNHAVDVISRDTVMASRELIVVSAWRRPKWREFAYRTFRTSRAESARRARTIFRNAGKRLAGRSGAIYWKWVNEGSWARRLNFLLSSLSSLTYILSREKWITHAERCSARADFESIPERVPGDPCWPG